MVMIRPVFCTPLATALVLSPVKSPCSRNPRQQEHLVVHGQAEQDGQHQDRLGGVELAA